MGRDHTHHTHEGATAEDTTNVPGALHKEGEGEHALKEHGGQLKHEHKEHKEHGKEHHGDEHGHAKGHGHGHGHEHKH